MPPDSSQPPAQSSNGWQHSAASQHDLPPTQPLVASPVSSDMPSLRSGTKPAAPSLGQTMRELLRQYGRIAARPGVQTFIEEQDKGTWDAIRIQLLFLLLIGVVQAVLNGLFDQTPNVFVSWLVTPITFGLLFALYRVPFPLDSLVTLILSLMPIAFIGVQYLLAKALRSKGTLKAHISAQLLFQTPITFVTYMLGLLLGALAGSFMVFVKGSNGVGMLLFLLTIIIPFALFITSFLMNICAIQAVHRLSTGKAALVVLIPWGVFFLLVALWEFLSLVAFMNAFPSMMR